jgi:hypothetical protein
MTARTAGSSARSAASSASGGGEDCDDIRDEDPATERRRGLRPQCYAAATSIASDNDNLDEAVERLEVAPVARVEGQTR